MESFVHLYVEGGQLDGEAFLIGPFASEEEAATEAGVLATYGTTQVLPVYRDAAALIPDLEYAREEEA